ncbi:MAG: hypothetical protein CL388_07675 [Acidiferrobacteraceae bacterium]|jgi:hypothetical protein|nr:hypothetical protein [Acidiferrobacteraceae bacterium]MDP6434515.1 hypothetical protein [Arenicellales bacterium]|tara:strand:- start:15982 stop:16419 length:438 start_codon:yes stop_codon:yes gene_type:complete
MTQQQPPERQLEAQIELLVLSCLETAKAMLKEYDLVVPFGMRVFKDSDDQKMNCPADENREADWLQQIEMVVTELKQYLTTENISATVLVTGLESDDQKGIGLQIETEQSSVMFVYPYTHKEETIEIEEPIQSDQLFSRVFEPGS